MPLLSRCRPAVCNVRNKTVPCSAGLREDKGSICGNELVSRDVLRAGTAVDSESGMLNRPFSAWSVDSILGLLCCVRPRHREQQTTTTVRGIATEAVRLQGYNPWLFLRLGCQFLLHVCHGAVCVRNDLLFLCQNCIPDLEPFVMPSFALPIRLRPSPSLSASIQEHEPWSNPSCKPPPSLPRPLHCGIR